MSEAWRSTLHTHCEHLEHECAEDLKAYTKIKDETASRVRWIDRGRFGTLVSMFVGAAYALSNPTTASLLIVGSVITDSTLSRLYPYRDMANVTSRVDRVDQLRRTLNTFRTVQLPTHEQALAQFKVAGYEEELVRIHAM